MVDETHLRVYSFRAFVMKGMLMVSRYLAVISALLISAVFSAHAEVLTLEEAVGIAIESNLSVSQSSERTEEIRGMIKEAKSNAYPQIDFIGTFSRYRDPGMLNSAAFSDLALAGFTLASPAEKRYNAGFYLTQSLYTWGRIPGAIKAAKHYYSQSESDLEATVLGVGHAVAVEFYYLNLVQNEITVLEKSKEIYEENLRVTRNRIEVGDATKLDLLKAQVALANIEPQLLEKKNALSQSHARLNMLMNRDISTAFEAQCIAPEVTRREELSIETLVGSAIRNRPELKSLESEKSAIEKTADVYRSDMKPSLSFSGNWGRSVEDHDNLTKSDFDSWSVALNLTVPIFNGFETRGKLIQMSARERQLESSIAELLRQIEYEVTEAYNSLLKSLGQLDAAVMGLEQAEEALRLISERYSLGLSTTLELLDSEREKRQSHLNFSQAEYNCNKSLADLKRALGLLPTDSIKD